MSRTTECHSAAVFELLAVSIIALGVGLLSGLWHRFLGAGQGAMSY